jgi:hypothetical protein
MIKDDYSYTIERLNGLVYILAVEKGNIKERLIIALLHKWETRECFPDHLKIYFDKINKIVACKNADEYQNAFERSLYRKKLSTCCDIAEKIYDLNVC